MFTISSIFSRFCQPCVMGILNVTPDSFAVHCQALTEEAVVSDFQSLVDQGSSIIDIGGCSTRPGATPVSEQEEWRRLCTALVAIRNVWPDYPISIDTFRASIAQRAIEQFQACMINDISGMADEQMLPLVARTRVPYVLTHPREACVDWDDSTHVMERLLTFFSQRLDELHRAGIADVIIDPGLGFGKSLEQNYAILRHLPILKQLHTPILIGLSRKSMIYKTLNTTPANAHIGTIAANMLALMQGANILRVHDVEQTNQTIDIYQQFLNNK